MILAGDIGGTKTLLALAGDDGIVHERRFTSRDWADFPALLRAFLDDTGGPATITAACFGVAGPVEDNRAKVTYLPWLVDGKALAETFGIGSVAVLNDFATAAQGVAALQPGDLVTLQEGRPLPQSPRLLIGAGTGLGVAALLPEGSGWRTVGGEGGHIGFSPADVRHVVLTHLDLDHAGGITDFPHAKIHSHSDEQEAALAQASLKDRNRYRACHFTHGPDWAIYRDVAGGEPWNGFSAVRDLVGLPPEILAVPLPGHTVGHAAIAVDAEGGWLLHAGDAYFHAATVDPRRGAVSIGATLFERAVAVDYAKVRQNHARLRALAESGAARVFSAHDPDEFDTRRRALAS